MNNVPVYPNSNLPINPANMPKGQPQSSVQKVMKWCAKAPIAPVAKLVDGVWNCTKFTANTVYSGAKLVGNAATSSINHIGNSVKETTNTVCSQVREKAHKAAELKSNMMKYAKKAYVVTVVKDVELNFNPLSWSNTNDPRNTLREINEISKKGLKIAELNGVKPDPATNNLQEELNQLNALSTTSSRINGSNVVGEVALIPKTEKDEAITRAPNLKERADADPNYWHNETEKFRKNLSKKLTIFSTLLKMQEWSGVPESDNQSLRKLVNEATEINKNKSVWQIFKNHLKSKNIKLSWFQTFKAGLFYLFAYKTSLIENTVNAYSKHFVEKIKNDLTSETKRGAFFKELIKNVDEFLDDDMGATERYSKSTSGSLEEFRNKAIEKFYSENFTALCKNFSEEMVSDKHPITVPFLRSAQEIPVIRVFFKLIESFVNRFIIRRLMRSTILPPALESALKNGIEATQTKNLPFTIVLTQFITERLEQLRDILDEPGNSGPPIQFPGTDKLPTTVDKLLTCLDIEPLETREQLNDHFAKQKRSEDGMIKKWVMNPLDQKVKGAIKEGIVQACHHLFTYLDATASSGELFAHPLRLACTLFDPVEKSAASLRAEYEEEHSKMKRVAKDLFDKIIDKAIEEQVHGEDTTKLLKGDKNKKSPPETVLERQKKIIEITFDKLEKLSENISEKILSSTLAPSPENNTQTDIASFLRIMQVLANRKELQEEIKNLRKHEQEAIWKALSPFYERAQNTLKKILELQAKQDDYTSDFAVANKLKFIKDFLQSEGHQLHDGPLHLKKLFIQPLKEKCEEIASILGSNAPLIVGSERLPHSLKGSITKLSVLSDSIVREEQALLALKELYPLREDGQVTGQEGLIEQLLNLERGIPTPISRKECLARIAEQLEHLRTDPNVPTAEEIELQNIILDGTNLASKWVQLAAVMQRIYNGHALIKHRDTTKFDEELREIQIFIEDKHSKYDQLSKDDHASMKEKIDQIGREINQFKNEISKAKANLPIDVPLPVAIAISSIVGGTVLGAAGGLVSWSAKSLWNLPTLGQMASSGVLSGISAIGSAAGSTLTATASAIGEGAVGTTSAVLTGGSAALSALGSAANAIKSAAVIGLTDSALSGASALGSSLLSGAGSIASTVAGGTSAAAATLAGGVLKAGSAILSGGTAAVTAATSSTLSGASTALGIAGEAASATLNGALIGTPILGVGGVAASVHFGKKAVAWGGKKYVRSEVDKNIANAYKLILSDRIYKAFATRGMKAIATPSEGQ